MTRTTQGPSTIAMLASALLLAACGGTQAPSREASERAPATQPATSETPSATSPASPTAGDAAPTRHEARPDGYGPLRLGMTAAQAEAAWPGLLAGTAGALQRRDCFHVGAGVSHFALMFDDGRFVRYGGSPDDVAAPGGGRRGMGEAALQMLYRNALQAAPDRFVRGGKRLSMQASGVAPSKLVFVLRPDGAVNEWYAGLLPQADYDAGCESDA